MNKGFPASRTNQPRLEAVRQPLLEPNALFRPTQFGVRHIIGPQCQHPALLAGEAGAVAIQQRVQNRPVLVASPIRDAPALAAAGVLRQIHDFIDDAEIAIVVNRRLLRCDFGEDQAPESDIGLQTRWTRQCFRSQRHGAKADQQPAQINNPFHQNRHFPVQYPEAAAARRQPPALPLPHLA